MDIVEHQISEGRDLGFTGLAYYDDIFIVNKRRTLELLELHKRYNTVFRCFLRSDILRIKDNIHKGTTIEQDTMVLEWCKDLGVTCKMSFIFGLPGESYESMNRTRDWILKNKPTITQVDRLIPFPGTPLTNHPEQYDLKYEEQPDEEWFFRGRHDIDSHSFVSTSHLTRDEIDTFWRSFEKELVAEGMSGYNH
jgi:radical SAM superfamily enzyme YgiQ (UPF0313 family)